MRAAAFALGILAVTYVAWASPASADEGQTPEGEAAPAPAQTESAATESESPELEQNAEDVVSAVETAVRGPDASPTGAGRRLPWRDEWPRYSFDEAVLSIGLGALLLVSELVASGGSSSPPNWRGGILSDGAVREGLRLRAYDSRESARLASEVLMWTLVAFPFAVDALAAVGIGDSSWDAAVQMGLIGIEAYVIALVIWKASTLLSRRERPVASACNEGLDSAHCTDANRDPSSFFSNQTLNAFTGASLVCLHHTQMPIFGDDVADASTCVAGLTAASVVGLLRVMSDFEYLSDVVIAAIVGFASGYLVPWILHYSGGQRPELRPAPAIAAIPVPMVGANETYGLTVAGWF